MLKLFLHPKEVTKVIQNRILWRILEREGGSTRRMDRTAQRGDTEIVSFTKYYQSD
jgi:hypothetical protein